MRIAAIARPWSIAVFIVLGASLIPRIPDSPERSGDADIDMVRSTECEYRGIRASFEELTRAYALKVFAHQELVGWEARPDPRHPDTGALVAARFAVSGLRPADGRDGGDRRPSDADRLRADVGDELTVTWHLNTLGALRVAPQDEYARDAVAVFQQTVDGFLSRMIYLTEGVDLRDGPSPQAASVIALDMGTVLLQERQEGSWVRVRVPSTSTSGWVLAERVQHVNN